MKDRLQSYLATLESDDCYRVESVLKRSDCETTEKVYLIGHNGEEFGPFIRKTFDRRGVPGNGSAYERLMEAQAAGARFLHIPRMFACSLRGDRLTAVVEYVEGDTLECVMEAVGEDAATRLRRTAPIFADLCDAVEELHTGFTPPLIHRDIKPGNVLVTKAGAMLIDFGIARSFKEGQTCDTTHFGTAPYAPPEQFGFSQTDRRSDVYALGMVLCFCLTGKHPDGSPNVRDFRDPAIPAIFRDVLMRATALDPAARFDSARQLKDAFLQAYDGYRASAAISIAAQAGVATASAVQAAVGQAVATSHTVQAAVGQASATPPVTQVGVGRTAATPPVAQGVPYANRARVGAWESLERTLSGMSPLKGALWDVLLLLVGVFFFCAVTAAVFYPNEPVSYTPVTGSIICYTIFVLIPAVLLFPVFDKRFMRGWMERRFPRYSALSLKRRLLASLIAAAALLIPATVLLTVAIALNL